MGGPRVAKNHRVRVIRLPSARSRASPIIHVRRRPFSCTWLGHVGGSTLFRDNPRPSIHLRPSSPFFLSLGYSRNCRPQIRTRRCRSPLLHNALARATVCLELSSSSASSLSPSLFLSVSFSSSASQNFSLASFTPADATRGWFTVVQPIIFEIGRKEAAKCEIARKPSSS